MSERLVRDLAIEEAIQIEIKPTLTHNNQLYVQWCAISDDKINKNKVKLTVTYDMGRQNRSGRIYDSYSSYAFIICGVYKGIIGVVFYSKAWRKCDAANKRGKESE